MRQYLGANSPNLCQHFSVCYHLGGVNVFDHDRSLFSVSSISGLMRNEINDKSHRKAE